QVKDNKALEMLQSQGTKSILEAIRHELENIEEIDKEFAASLMKKVQKATGIRGKNLFMPTRVALTGSLHGPEFVKVIYLLGKENLLERIEYVEKNYF
ncbi:MAG TPA: glutamate--tRNA ligase, partial [Tissierellaceae bacterium]|nr:glutamate--tRNA ligase [Tissierellaceae bacterium]